ncbi:MAG TPA: hypothetical protein VF682_00540 [Pseudomonas sp.]|jgi:hypothetical protein
MRSYVTNALFSLVVLAASAAAAQPSAPSSFPHIPLMSHDTMTYNGKVIYDAYVDLADPARKQTTLKIDLDGFSKGCDSLVGHVATDSEWKRSGVSGYSISCVVRDLGADGSAKVDVIYSLRDPSRGVNKSEHITATVKSGQRYESTTPTGTKVTMLLNLQ